MILSPGARAGDGAGKVERKAKDTGELYMTITF